MVRTQWAREKGEAKSHPVPLTQTERQVSLLTGGRAGRSPVLSPHSGDFFPRLPPRLAKWFTLCRTPTTKMVFPCCLPAHSPHTRAGCPYLWLSTPAPLTHSRISAALGANYPFILKPFPPRPSGRQTPSGPPHSRIWQLRAAAQCAHMAQMSK